MYLNLLPKLVKTSPQKISQLRQLVTRLAAFSSVTYVWSQRASQWSLNAATFIAGSASISGCSSHEKRLCALFARAASPRRNLLPFSPRTTLRIRGRSRLRSRVRVPMVAEAFRIDQVDSARIRSQTQIISIKTSHSLLSLTLFSVGSLVELVPMVVWEEASTWASASFHSCH